MYHSQYVFLRASVKEKEKQKQKLQEQHNEIIIGSQVEPSDTDSKYLSWPKFRDLYLRRPEIL